LSCLGCCRYNSNPSIWTANLLEEEKRRLSLERIKLLTYQGSYICSFLNPESNFCRIYAQRPLECHLYPFLLNRCEGKIYLSLDSDCPYTLGKVNSKEFKRYLDYLIRYLQKPSILTVIRKNLQAFSVYPEEKILNLAELKINCRGI